MVLNEAPYKHIAKTEPSFFVSSTMIIMRSTMMQSPRSYQQIDNIHVFIFYKNHKNFTATWINFFEGEHVHIIWKHNSFVWWTHACFFNEWLLPAHCNWIQISPLEAPVLHSRTQSSTGLPRQNSIPQQVFIKDKKKEKGKNIIQIFKYK